MYTRIALGKSSAMDVVGGESSGSTGQLLLLYPMLFALQALQVGGGGGWPPGRGPVHATAPAAQQPSSSSRSARPAGRAPATAPNPAAFLLPAPRPPRAPLPVRRA